MKKSTTRYKIRIQISTPYCLMRWLETGFTFVSKLLESGQKEMIGYMIQFHKIFFKSCGKNTVLSFTLTEEKFLP